MNRWIPVAGILLIATAFSCGGEGDEAPKGDPAGTGMDMEIDPAGPASDTLTVEEPGAAEPEAIVARLEFCYATSTNTPEERYGPENAFDGDSATYWATMPGAAPDEGIYLAFEEPQSIRQIIVETVPHGPEFEGVDRIQVYFDGMEGEAGSPGTPIGAYGGTSFSSVFVKIAGTRTMNYDQHGIRYRRDVPAGISGIRLYDRVGGELVPLEIVPLREMPGTVEASSSLEPSEAYRPDFLFDSRTSFGWADGNTNRSGVGESLTFRFHDPQRIERIKIWNGYHRSGEHYVHNERASLISFGIEGEEGFEIVLEDTMEPQEIFLEEPLEGTDFTMEVLDVYPGEVYRDLVISELRFGDAEGWFALESGMDEARKSEVLQWAENTDAAVFIDRQLYDGRRSYGDHYEQSLVIRSNGSFVIWKISGGSDSDEPARMYADGNWQILDDSTIRIFGRLHRIATLSASFYNPYAGFTAPDQEHKLDRMTIFSDTLRFGADWISSSRGLFEDFEF